VLLQRTMDHLKRQNWLAVVLEFLIVVFGVVVAFQLQSWGEERAAGVRAQQSLHQLYEESEDIVDAWAQSVRYNDKLLALQDRVVARFSAGDRGELADDELAEGLATISYFPTISPPRRIFDELKGAGLLREIDASEVLAAVSSYYEQLEFVQGQLGHFRPDTDTARDLRYGRGINYVYDGVRPVRRRIEVNFGQLVSDPVFVHTLVGVLRNRIVFQSYRRQVLISAVKMCQSLAAAVGEPCAPSKEYEDLLELPKWQAVPDGS